MGSYVRRWLWGIDGLLTSRKPALSLLECARNVGKETGLDRGKGDDV